MKSSLNACALAILFIFSAYSQAGTVTFDPLISGSGGPAGNGTTYLEGGLTFTSSSVSQTALFHKGSSDPTNADPGGATLYQTVTGGRIEVTKTGGGNFFLQSFDLADLENTGASALLTFGYIDGSGVVHNTNLALDSAVGLQTFNFGFEVASFRLTQSSPFFQIDNIVTNVTAVPEPETYTLLLAGLGLVGLAIKRRRRLA